MTTQELPRFFVGVNDTNESYTTAHCAIVTFDPTQLARLAQLRPHIEALMTSGIGWPVITFQSPSVATVTYFNDTSYSYDADEFDALPMHVQEALASATDSPHETCEPVTPAIEAALVKPSKVDIELYSKRTVADHDGVRFETLGSVWTYESATIPWSEIEHVLADYVPDDNAVLAE